MGQSQAVAMIAAASHEIPVSTYAPREVKKAVTDNGGSSKEQVQDMVQFLLDLPSPLLTFQTERTPQPWLYVISTTPRRTTSRCGSRLWSRRSYHPFPAH